MNGLDDSLNGSLDASLDASLVASQEVSLEDSLNGELNDTDLPGALVITRGQVESPPLITKAQKKAPPYPAREVLLSPPPAKRAKTLASVLEKVSPRLKSSLVQLKAKEQSPQPSLPLQPQSDPTAAQNASGLKTVPSEPTTEPTGPKTVPAVPSGPKTVPVFGKKKCPKPPSEASTAAASSPVSKVAVEAPDESSPDKPMPGVGSATEEPIQPIQVKPEEKTCKKLQNPSASAEKPPSKKSDSATEKGGSTENDKKSPLAAVKDETKVAKIPVISNAGGKPSPGTVIININVPKLHSPTVIKFTKPSTADEKAAEREEKKIKREAKQRDKEQKKMDQERKRMEKAILKQEREKEQQQKKLEIEQRKEQRRLAAEQRKAEKEQKWIERELKKAAQGGKKKAPKKKNQEPEDTKTTTNSPKATSPTLSVSHSEIPLPEDNSLPHPSEATSSLHSEETTVSALPKGTNPPTFSSPKATSFTSQVSPTSGPAPTPTATSPTLSTSNTESAQPNNTPIFSSPKPTNNSQPPSTPHSEEPTPVSEETLPAPTFSSAEATCQASHPGSALSKDTLRGPTYTVMVGSIEDSTAVDNSMNADCQNPVNVLHPKEGGVDGQVKEQQESITLIQKVPNKLASPTLGLTGMTAHRLSASPLQIMGESSGTVNKNRNNNISAHHSETLLTSAEKKAAAKASSKGKGPALKTGPVVIKGRGVKRPRPDDDWDSDEGCDMTGLRSSIQLGNVSGPVWVQCADITCHKWRKLESYDEPSKVPVSWMCSMNPDKAHNTCIAPQEEWDVLPHEQFVETVFVPGTIVWGKMDSYPW